jgi:hypothetical protein
VLSQPIRRKTLSKNTWINLGITLPRALGAPILQNRGRPIQRFLASVAADCAFVGQDASSSPGSCPTPRRRADSG